MARYRGVRRDLLGSTHGAFRYLDDFLDGSDTFRIELPDVDATAQQAVTLIDNGGFRVRAVGVHHGLVPALGLFVEMHGKKIALAVQAGVAHLVLPHLMARSLDRLDESQRLIRKRYRGPVSVARDLACYPLEPSRG